MQPKSKTVIPVVKTKCNATKLKTPHIGRQSRYTMDTVYRSIVLCKPSITASRTIIKIYYHNPLPDPYIVHKEVEPNSLLKPYSHPYKPAKQNYTKEGILPASSLRV